MISALKACWPYKSSWSESQESLLTGSKKGAWSDEYETKPYAFNEPRAPSYFQRCFFGAPNAPTGRWNTPDVTKMSDAAVIAYADDEVRAFYNIHYGCTPEQFRPAMHRRPYMGSNPGWYRPKILQAFERLLKAEPSTAFRLLNQILGTPEHSIADRKATEYSLALDVLPHVWKYAKDPSSLSENARRDMSSAVESMASVWIREAQRMTEIDALRSALPG